MASCTPPRSPSDPLLEATFSPATQVVEGEPGVTNAQSRIGRTMAVLIGKLALSGCSMMLAILPRTDEQTTYNSIMSHPARAVPLMLCATWIGHFVIAAVTRIALVNAMRSYIFLEALRHRLFVQLRPTHFAYSASDWSFVLVPVLLAGFLVAWNGTSYSVSAGIIGVCTPHTLTVSSESS